tara:strand:- start:4001 stop:4282 length:282 start_codon:yes stop_codon:yes gene_type:complete
MCNLYRMTTPAEAVARLFGAEPDRSANFAAEVYPGYPGLVIADGRAQAMAWGFPLALKSKRTGQPLKPKPVTTRGRTSFIPLSGGTASPSAAA